MTRLSAATLLLAVLVAACGGSSEPVAEAPATTAPPEATATEPQADPPAAEPDPKPKALPGLPRFTAGYRDWTKLHQGTIPPRPDGDAHLGSKRVFASKERRANGRFPYGTIVVKEAERPGADFIGLIAIMRKERGFDPAHNDWEFVEYTREGPRARFGLTARDDVCWSCHAGAQETDYLWIYELGLAR